MPPSPAKKINEKTIKTIEEWIISLNPDARETCKKDPTEPPDSSDPDEPGDDDDEP